MRDVSLESGIVADTPALNCAHARLEAMPLAKRIAAIAADVETKRDEYQSIDSHELANLLGVGDADQPGANWKFVWYIPRVPVEDIFDSWNKEYVFELFQPHVTPERYEELDKKYEELGSKQSKCLISDFLTEGEKQTIERAYMEKQDKAYPAARCRKFRRGNFI